MTPLKSQILGLSLGLSTAIGCIFYEKIVQNFSLMTFMVIKVIELLFFLIAFKIILPSDSSNDFSKVISEPKYILWIIVYVLTGITTIIWYIITKEQGVMVSSLYEIKYIVMLALIYLAFGDNKFTINTAIGVCLAIGSIYFISKS